MEEYDELYSDDVEEEEISGGEGTNRTFIILVSAFGSILALGICAFVIYALVGRNWMAANQAAGGVDPGTDVSVIETPTQELTATVDALPGETVVPSTTATLLAGSGATRAAEGTGEATPDDVTPPAATPTSRVTPRPTFTPGPSTSTPTPTNTPVEVAGRASTATPGPTANSPANTEPPGNSPPLATPDTGLGTFGASVLVVGLLLLLVVVRQLRKAGR